MFRKFFRQASQTFDTRRFGAYEIPSLGATTFWSANYDRHEGHVVVDVPLAIMKHVLTRRTSNGIKPLPTWDESQQNTVIRGMLAGPGNRLPLAYVNYFDGALSFTNGRHRVAAPIYFRAPVIPLEMESESAPEFVAAFGLAAPRRSAAFIEPDERSALKILTGNPPGLSQQDNATIADDLRILQIYRKIISLESGNHRALSKLAGKRPDLICDQREFDLRGKDITERQAFLTAWEIHLARETKAGNGGKPSLLPLNWREMPEVRTATASNRTNPSIKPEM